MDHEIQPKLEETQALEEAQAFASSFAALGHPARLLILRSLLRSHPDGKVVGSIQEDLGIPSSTLSHHLDALRHEELIEQQREGRFLRYRANAQALNRLTEFLFAGCCSESSVETTSSSPLRVL